MKLSLSNMQSAITRQEIARRVIDARALKVDEIIRRLSVGDIAGRGRGEERQRGYMTPMKTAFSPGPEVSGSDPERVPEIDCLIDN